MYQSKHSGKDIDDAVDVVKSLTEIPTVAVTQSKTLALTDKTTIQKCTSADATVVTLPLNSNVAFPLYTEIVIVRYGAGTVTIAGETGVTIYSSGSKKSIDKQYEAATIKKIDTDEWFLFGSLA